MEKRYFRLKDTSGTYWSVRLGVSFVRGIPLALESSPDLKMLLAKGVIVEISKSDFEALGGVVPGEVNDPDQTGEIVQPTAQDKATSDNNPPQMSAEVTAESTVAKDEPPVDLHAPVNEADVTAAESEPGEGVSDLPPVTDPVEQVTDPPEFEEPVTDPPLHETENIPPPPLPPLERKDANAMITAALERGFVVQNRGWFKFGEVTLGKGMTLAIQKLMSEPDLANKLRIELAG